MNNTNNNLEINKFILIDKAFYFIAFVSIGYIIQFITCVLGNGLELYILPRIKQSNDYITFAFCALACSDLLQAFLTMPFNYLRLIYFDWFLGDFVCKFQGYMSLNTRLTGIWIIVYIAFDRYMNICQKDQLSILKTKKICLIILVGLCMGHFVFFSYCLLTLKAEIDKKCMCITCKYNLSNVEYILNKLIVDMIYAFLLPVILSILFFVAIFKNILSFNYTFRTFLRSIVEDETAESQSDNLSIVKISFFLFCFFILFNFLNFSFVFMDITFLKTNISSGSRKIAGIVLFVQTLNSCLNPWIYYFYSKRYQYELMSLFHQVENAPKFVVVRQPTKFLSHIKTASESKTVSQTSAATPLDSLYASTANTTEFASVQ